MLRTRALIGSLLAALIVGVLIGDDFLAPWYPFLLGTAALIGYFACRELLGLIPEQRRPPAPLVYGGLAAVLAANWVRSPDWPDPWHLILGAVAGAFIAAFCYEMAVYREPGETVTRVAFASCIVVYLGVLTSFLIQLRWLPSVPGDPSRARNALLLTIFVPKCCDIGAYCTGRLIGRHKMTPRLSPKKTWEGAAGGLILAVATAILGSSFGQCPHLWPLKAVAFGAVVGVMGMLGDLAESLIKREGQKKDASQAVPGFGGVLDVIDSVLFAAPVAYIWLNCPWISPL